MLAFHPAHPQAYDTGSNSSALEYGVTRLNSNLSPMQGILVELLLTFLLVTVFLHTTMEKTEMRPVAPVLIGLALTAAVVSRCVVKTILVVHDLMGTLGISSPII